MGEEDKEGKEDEEEEKEEAKEEEEEQHLGASGEGEVARAARQEEEGFGDMMSEVDLINGARLVRQITAPPASSSRSSAGHGFRVRGTFMEALDMDSELPVMSKPRSWSDGDLRKMYELEEALESEGPSDMYVV